MISSRRRPAAQAKGSKTEDDSSSKQGESSPRIKGPLQAIRPEPSKSSLHQPSQKTLESFAQKFEILDIPHSELLQMRHMIEQGQMTTFKQLLLHIMHKCRNVMPDAIARSIGGHIGEEESQSIKWEQFLNILEEEVAIKEKLFNQMNFGSNKILFEFNERICLSNTPREFFYHDYKMNFFIGISGQIAEAHRNLLQKTDANDKSAGSASLSKEWAGTDEEDFGMYVMIINDNCLCITDEKFSKILSRTYFTRDATKQIRQKIDEENRRQAEQEKLRESLRNNISSLSQEEDSLRVQNGLILGEYHFDVLGHLAGESPAERAKKQRAARLRQPGPSRDQRGSRATEDHRDVEQEEELQRNVASRGRGTTQATAMSDRSARSSIVERQTNSSTNKGAPQAPNLSRDNSNGSHHPLVSNLKKVNEASNNTSSGLKLSALLQKEQNGHQEQPDIEPAERQEAPNQNSLTSITQMNVYPQNQLAPVIDSPVAYAKRTLSSSKPTQSRFSKSILRPSIILKDVVVGSTTTHPKSTLKTAKSWEIPDYSEQFKTVGSKPSTRLIPDVASDSRKPSIYATHASAGSKNGYNLEIASFEDKSEIRSKREISTQRERVSQRIDSKYRSKDPSGHQSRVLPKQNSVMMSVGNSSQEDPARPTVNQINSRRGATANDIAPASNIRAVSMNVDTQQHIRKRVSTLPPIAGLTWAEQSQKKEAYSKAKLDSILSKSVDLARDESVEGRKRHHKLFNEFRTLIATDLDRPATGIFPDNVDEYQDGDSYFEEVDVQQVEPLDLMLEYQKRGIATQTKRVATTYMKNSKQLLKKIVKIGQALGSNNNDDALQKPEDGQVKGGSILGSEASQISRSEAAPPKHKAGRNVGLKQADKRRLMGPNAGSVFQSVVGYRDPQRLENYKAWHDRPRNGKEMLTCVSVFYWRTKSLLLVSFLTRELMSFSFNQYRGEHFIRKGEEVVLEDCANQICVLKDEFGGGHEYLALEVGFKSIEVYEVPIVCEPANLLKTVVNKGKLLYRIRMDWENPKCKLLRSGIVVVGEDKQLTVHKMLSPRTFGVGFEVSLMQKYRAVTVKDIDFSGRLNLLLVGTNQGDVYLIDCEISLVMFRIHKHRCPIVKLRICEVLKCFMVFWENGRYGLYDLLTYRIVQEFNILEGSESKRNKCTWSYIPEIDEDMETMIPGKDFYDPEIRQKLGKVIEDRVSTGLYSIFFGESTFTRLKMKIDVELQFSEILAKIKMLERQGKDWSKDTLFGKDISHVVIHKKPVWIFQKIVPELDSILLVNDRKLLVYLNYIENLIVRYSLIQIEGNIVCLEISNSKREIYIANDRGVAMIYNILHMNAIMKYELNLDRVIYCEFILHDGFDVAMFQVPDEGYVVRSASSYRTHAVVNVDNPKECVLFRFESELVLTATDASNVYCLLANYGIAVVSRRNMRMVREFDLMDTPVKQIIEYSLDGSSEILHRPIISMKMNNNTIYLLFDNNLLVIIAFNPSSHNDFRIFTQTLPIADFHFTVSHDNRYLFILTGNSFEVYNILLIDPDTGRRVFENYASKNSGRSSNISPVPVLPSLSPNVSAQQAQPSGQTDVKGVPTGSSPQPQDTSRDSGFSPQESPRALRRLNSTLTLDSSPENPPLSPAWSIPLPDSCSANRISSIEFLASGRNSQLVYLHPKEGSLHFVDVGRQKYRGELDISLMIQQNKTFDQKRLNEKNMLNVRNILRHDGPKHKTTGLAAAAGG